MRERPSVYLQEKCANLEKVIDFFLMPQGTFLTTIGERLLSFLSQIDFWEWEIDNLVFSFATFEERSRAWEFEKGLIEGVQSQGMMVQKHLFNKLKEKRHRKKGQGRKVVPPYDRLTIVVDKWNQLLRLCEDRVLLPRAELDKLASLGAQILLDLTKFRKRLPRGD